MDEYQEIMCKEFMKIFPNANSPIPTKEQTEKVFMDGMFKCVAIELEKTGKITKRKKINLLKSKFGE